MRSLVEESDRADDDRKQEMIKGRWARSNTTHEVAQLRVR